MFDTIDEKSLERLVDVFYTKARNDKDLGAVFKTRINSDAKWEKHKEMLRGFWSYHLINSDIPRDPKKKREGGMIGVHKNLSPFPREHFGVWLGLFEETLNELFIPEMRDKILNKAKQMAQTLQEVMYEGVELQGPPHWCPKHKKDQENA